MRRYVALAAVFSVGLTATPAAVGKTHTSQKVLTPTKSIEVKGRCVRIRNIVIRVTNDDGHGTYGNPWHIAPSKRGGVTVIHAQASDGEALAIRVGPHVAKVRVPPPAGWPFPCPNCTVIRATVHWGDSARQAC
jgi:hypothetical protein